MASSSSTLSTAISHRWHRRQGSHPPYAATERVLFFPTSASFIHRSLLALKLKSRPVRCRANSPGPPPQSEPPSNKIPQQIKGIGTSFIRFKDTVQIFAAVLFWMSLFFWSSAWDGRNNDRRNKGSRFRK
ncbi:hypothetical protein F511_02613 [Dorcoceras hygrometricum]|uniref:Uncharacterized protein n=1 Tax=Dorcoceras hygrometricum TaxID=472368 RepID=A0A2Z7AMA5_9LAMI|nr:hypothetical protein F511_02613 [Dorcoceras hygrometricum]